MTNKIIFLDFDGPLSNARVTLSYGDDDYMDPVALGALNNICEASGTKIVCTSTRAVVFSGHREDCLWRFKQAGLDISHVHHDWSCNDDNGGNRYQQIETWLKQHPGVTHYAVVDDENVRNINGRNHPKLVKTSMYDGISFKDYEKIARLLDFRLTKAFNKARESIVSRGQFILPFDDYQERRNSNLPDHKPN